MADSKTVKKEKEITKIFQDVRTEVTAIKDEKTQLEEHLDKIKSDLKNIQLKEVELRDLIADFTSKETQLSTKRMAVEKKLNAVNAKIDKLSKIQGELSEVWE